MIVRVVAEGTLADRVPSLEGGVGPVEVDGDATVADVLRAVGLSPAGPHVAVLGGAVVRPDTRVPTGATLHLHALAAGGA